MRHYLKNTLVFILGFTVIGAFGQEYDDLYFTKKDRKKKKQVQVTMNDPANESRDYVNSDFQSEKNDENLSFLGRQFKENNPLLDEGVSQESLDYYAPEKTQEDYINAEEQDQNPNFSSPQSSVYFNDGSVYDNNGNFNNSNAQQPVIVNNYYNDNWNTWNRWNRPGLNVGFGWNSWGGNFWSVGFGNSWGNPWYDPFWDPWWGWNAWGPRWGWNAGWGWNSWGWNAGWGWGGIYDPFWCSPYRGIYNRPVYIVGDRRGRNVVRGARNSRGSVATRSSRSSSGRRSDVSASDINATSRRVNYNRQQAEYLNRSRSNTRYNSNASRGAETINSRTSNSSSSRNSVFNNSSNARSGTNNSFSRPSNNVRNRTYSQPASSRGSSSRSYTPSRSSGSRSSGSVSRGSSSGSRSSGSRSSSGRSSSGRRGGN